MKTIRTHVILFLVFIFGGTVLNIVVPTDVNRLESEQRTRKPWPALQWNAIAEGKYVRDLEEAFADHFVFRSQALQFADRFKALGALPWSQVQIVTGSRGDIFADPGKPGEEKKPGPAGAWVNGILIIGKTAYTTAGYAEDAAVYYANAVNGVVNKLDAKIRVYCLLAPSAIEFLDDPRYKSFTYSQAKGIQQIYAKLSQRVARIDIIPELSLHSSEYLFHRTDHHWQGLGAYYAYRAAAPVLGVQPYSLDKYPKESLPNFIGSLHRATGSPILAANPDTEELIYPFVENKMTVYTAAGGSFTGKAVDKSFIINTNKYLAYIAGDYPLSIITSNSAKGRKILVIKDSNANAFIPFLVPHFEEVHVIDPRYWNGNILAYVKEKGIGEVMFVQYYPIISNYNGLAYNIARNTGN